MATAVTQWLDRARAGEAGALDAAYAALYEELKQAARRQLRRERAPLDTTVLVHEAYLKLFGHTPPAAKDRDHLLAIAARAMRQVLVDRARGLRTRRRDGMLQVTLGPELGSQERAVLEVVALDDLLSALQRIDARAAEVVELRYFGGYGEPEIARMLGVSDRTVRRDWRRARAFLQARMQP